MIDCLMLHLASDHFIDGFVQKIISIAWGLFESAGPKLFSLKRFS
jgi:hypothetical protein